MAAKGITYLLLGAQRPDVGDAVRPFARLMRLGEEEARDLLVARGPRLFRAYLRRAEAQGVAGQIRALGLEAATLTPVDIWEYVFVSARQLNIGQGGISSVGGAGEAPMFVPYGDIAALVRGEVAELPAPTPAADETAPRVATLTPQPENGDRTLLLDIHRHSVPVALRIRRSDFRMNPAVAGEAIADPTDLDRFVELVLRRATRATLDTGFNLAPESVDWSLRMLDAGEQVAMRPRTDDGETPTAPPSPPPAPERTPTELIEPVAFDLYSTLRRFQALCS